MKFPKNSENAASCLQFIFHPDSICKTFFLFPDVHLTGKHKTFRLKILFKKTYSISNFIIKSIQFYKGRGSIMDQIIAFYRVLTIINSALEINKKILMIIGTVQTSRNTAEIPTFSKNSYGYSYNKFSREKVKLISSKFWGRKINSKKSDGYC